jgi:beta-aspartyl-peptidase (threonine type)
MMNRLIVLFLFIFMSLVACDNVNIGANKEWNKHKGEIAIAIHGGAGNLKKLNLTEAQEKEYEHLLDSALTAGYAALHLGESSEKVVELVIRIMEDSPLFNAGKGAVLNHDGVAEMDAAIMNGLDESCGAVAGLRHIKNPISAARMVKNESKYVFLTGAGAEDFLITKGMDTVANSYFITPERLKQWQEAVAEDTMSLDHDKAQAWVNTPKEEWKYGTVGCVALDMNGNLCAGTSTGGLVNKRYGRVGDSPLIGAGTYASNNSCAISCTGKGEDFIRFAVAKDIASIFQYEKLPLDTCVKKVLFDKVKAAKGRGGVIAVNRKGEVSMQFTTTGMYRASIDGKGNKVVAIYREGENKDEQ